ncbi:MAG: NERD domain-containing protein [Gammaproteobacteria bacterium]|nr:NERD domain-containing protein [Candidatus Brocadiales bacterium]MBL7004881.1 NERD domain-containing protein [Gammaproteobacteria bacterium]
MGFKAFRGNAFNHSHENQAFNALYDILQAECEVRDDQLYLFGNFFVAGKEFDALIVKNNAIIVIDFKNFGGELTFSENGPWYCDGIVVKGGNSRNPFLQLRNNKFALLDYIKSGHIEFSSKPNLGHIAGLVMFHQPIEVDETKIPQQIKSWFHICDYTKAIRTIDGIASAEIDLSRHELDLIAETFAAPEYFPDGKPVTKTIATKNIDPAEGEFTPTNFQKSVLKQAEDWLTSEGCTFVLKGMSSTGKRTLLREVLRNLEEKNKSPLLIAPNARIANKYTALGLGEFSSIYQVLYSKKSDGVVKKSNGVELAKHPIVLTSEQLKDKVLVIVEAHLISNSYYDMDSAVFGSGHMVNDLLTAFDNEPPKLLLVGDPYQLSRGDLDQCLLSGQAIRDKELSIEEAFLEQQIESEPKELHDFQFEIAQQMQLKQFNQLPIADNDVVSSIDNSPSIGADITSGRYHAVYLTAINDVAQKINFAAKQKVLQQANPYVLNVGDLIDFHSSSPVIYSQGHANEFEPSNDWIHSGEVATVTAVDEHIYTIELQLKGRDVPTSVRIGYFYCNVPSLGDVKLSYIVDYLHADKPELSTDQMLVLSIKAREQATEAFKGLKDNFEKLKDTQPEQYKAEKKKYNELVQNHIAYSPLLNAARIRYAYAMTVHRAQGRQWNLAYLDASRGASGESITNDGYFRFIYTASMCTESGLRLLKYPKLTPLYQSQFIPNNNCKVGAFPISKGFSYQHPEKADLEKFNYPVGFTSDVEELRAICFSVSNKLKDSKWRISEVKQYSYQELYTFEHDTGKKVRVRFTYDKNITVKTLAFPDESKEQALTEELKTLLDSEISFDEQRLDTALQSIKSFFESFDFEVVEAKRLGEWEMQVICVRESEAIQLKAWVVKNGLISKIMPEKATSEEVINLFKGALNEQ